MKYKNINAKELKELMLDNSILIDVRTPIEWFSNKISESVLVPLADINFNTILEICDKKVQKNLLDDKKSINLIFYCRSGSRSIQAIEKTFNENFCLNKSNKYNFMIYNLTHGIDGYKKETT